MEKNQKEIKQKEIPHEWICPITQQIMIDPVIADDGFTYQRKTIENWFKNSNISPITGLALSLTKLIPNRVLKNIINQYLLNQKLILKKNESNQNKLDSQNNEKKHQIVDQKLQLSASSIFIQEQNDYLINLQIISPKISKISEKQRKCISMICILDISDSMSTDAVKDSKNTQSHGFSRLDLVKHSIKTLLQFMKNQDQLTLIVFNTSAKCILTTTKMTKAGKNLALNKINQLQGSGTTNIWDGLRIALETYKNMDCKDKNIYTVLLTDGQPNLNPPRGIIPTLNKYIQVQKISNPNIHVFGYGYQLDTKLLEQISRKGAGTYSYIPDCSMVGTVFINFMANCLSAITNRVLLEISSPSSNKKIQILQFKQNKKNTYNLGMIQFGQNRNVFIKIQNLYDQKEPFPIKFILRYGTNLDEECSLEINSNLKNISQINIQKSTNIKIRYQYLRLLKKCIQNKNKFQLSLNQIKLFYFYLKKQIQTEFINILCQQIKDDNDQNYGQVQKAFLKQEWFNKWGKNYIPSLLLAHLMQICTNFKDPALQLYGGQLFQKYRNQMDQIFIKMQAPKPSAKKEKNIVYKPAPVNMSHYYQNYGGCIDGQCEVQIWKYNQNCSDKQLRMIKQKLKNVKKGDIIGQNKVQIQCIVETNIFALVQMVKVQNLLITPWHPIFYKDKWVFPIDIQPSKNYFVQKYYNFITKDNKNLEIQAIQCISLGHQNINNQVIYHEYLSTQKVIQDLKSNQRAFNQGKVTIKSVERDQNTKKINKFIVY